ncbi:MAG: OmpA family protein [Saprospiraceae bacterium]
MKIEKSKHMKWCKYLFLLVLLLTGFVTNAQNKKYDWSIGTNGGIYSYSAVLERKLPNPYEYKIGVNLTVSRYINHHFDLSLQGNRSPINFPVAILDGEPLKYQETNLYSANFQLKYKLDNGYILKEHTMFAPYIMLGGGASLTTLMPEVTYIAPVGLGVQVHLGERTSLIFESQYNHDFVGPLSYMQNNIGLRVHFGKANKKRVKATRLRERERRYAKIRKYRAEQRLVQAQKAKERLERMKTEGLVGNMMTMEEDTDLLDTETILLNNELPPIVVSDVNTPPSKPKEATIVQKINTESVVTQPEISPAAPTIPESPGKSSVEETKPKLEEKPSMPKPIREEVENMPIVEEEKPTVAPTKPKEEIVEAVVKPIPAKPAKQAVEETKPILPKPQPPVEKPKLEEKPIYEIEAEFEEATEVVIEATEVVIEETIEEKPIKDENVCRNRETELSEIGANINFDSDRYRIRSRMHADLDKIINILKACEDNSYVIIAHSDSDGDYEYNKKLSKRRAIVIKKYLMDHGIESSRLSVVAYSSSVPLAPNTSSNNKAKNRRIEFKLNRKSFDE